MTSIQAGVRRFPVAGILACLAGSAVSLIVAPLLMPDSYSVVSHTTSESAAQGMAGAWLARLGFVLFGLAVLWLSCLARRRWGRWPTIFHTGFGVTMIATAAFSARSWETETPFDRTEDVLHSAAATGMALAFTFGVLAVLVPRVRDGSSPRLLDVVAVVAALSISVGMAIWDDGAGMLQRTMFLVLYAWYASEAVATGRLETRVDVKRVGVNV